MIAEAARGGGADALGRIVGGEARWELPPGRGHAWVLDAQRAVGNAATGDLLGAMHEGQVHPDASVATSGAGGPLPHLEAIQRSFGRHDVSRITAHTDEAASAGARSIGAAALAMGNHVAFAGAAPSLHTAAHEAAHVIQQQAGVQLLGGLDVPGDRYERHADAVADLVVQDRSSEALLDSHPRGAAAPATGEVVQRKPDPGAVDDEVENERKEALTKRFGAFFTGRIASGATTPAEAARALGRYRATDAGKRDLFFHDNAVAGLAAKQKLEASNIAVESYEELAAASELVASGRYKSLPSYRQSRVEELEEQLAAATLKARESGLEVVRRAYREQGPMAALDAAKGIESFTDDPSAAVTLVRQEEQRRTEAERRADLIRQAKFRCKKELVANDEECNDFFDNLDQQATRLGADGEMEFSPAVLSAAPAKDWQLTAQERANRESLLTPEEKTDRDALHDAKKNLFRLNAVEGAGQALKTGFYDLVALPADLLTYGVNSLSDNNYAYTSSFEKDLSAELGKGEGTDVDRIRDELAKGHTADMSVIQSEIAKGRFNAEQIDFINYELRRGDRDFRKLQSLLEEGKGTDKWKVADLVGRTTLDVGARLLSFVPGAQGAGLLGQTARGIKIVQEGLSIYDTLNSTLTAFDAAAAGDGRTFGQALGGILQTPIHEYVVGTLKEGFGAGAVFARERYQAWRERGASGFDLSDPALHAARASGGGTGPSWSQMSRWERLKTLFGGGRAVENAKALEFDVDRAVDRGFSERLLSDDHIGKLSAAERKALAAHKSVPPAYIHGVRLGNALEFATETNVPVYGQVLGHLMFESEVPTLDVGSGGHGGVRGNSFIDDARLRDPGFVRQDELTAERMGAAANVWDLTDPQARKTWLSRRESAKSVQAGASARYSIADWCYSAFTGADKQAAGQRAPVEPLRNWEQSFDAWNERQLREGGSQHALAASKSGGKGLYTGSDVRAERIAEVVHEERMLEILGNPDALKAELFGGVRSADVTHASRSADPAVGGAAAAPPDAQLRPPTTTADLSRVRNAAAEAKLPAMREINIEANLGDVETYGQQGLSQWLRPETSALFAKKIRALEAEHPHPTAAIKSQLGERWKRRQSPSIQLAEPHARVKTPTDNKLTQILKKGAITFEEWRTRSRTNYFRSYFEARAQGIPVPTMEEFVRAIRLQEEALEAAMKLPGAKLAPGSGVQPGDAPPVAP